MWKLKHKKGYVLIEVMCSLILISLLINSMLIILKNSAKLHTDNKDRLKYINFMDALSKEVEWNLSYDDIINLKDSHRLYIDKSHMDVELLKHISKEELFSDIIPTERPYIEVSVTSGDILNINMNLYYNAFSEQKNMNISCYKGRYR